MLSKFNFSRLSTCATSAWIRLGERWTRSTEKARDERGAITIEYILIIALIAIIIITIFTIMLWPLLRPAIAALLGRIEAAINGGGIT